MIGFDTARLLEESWKAPRRLRNAWCLARKELTPKVAQTPCQEIARWGRVRLLRYEAAAPVQACPVLMIPSIINKYYILDLRPGQSLVEHLTQSGIPVYMLDWGQPGPQDRYATLEDHILRWLGAAVRRACRDAGIESIHLLGYCVGGTFATAYTALEPKRVRSLVALATPVNFHDEGILSSWANDPAFNVDRLAGDLGLIPADFLQGSFSLLRPVDTQKKTGIFAERMWDDKFVEGFLAVDAWLTDNVDFPGQTYARYIKDLYRDNLLLKGEFKLDGREVHLEDIHCPVLTVVSDTDHIVPEPSASMLHDLVSSTDKQLLRLPGGHIGISVGAGARQGFWKELRGWLTARPCSPAEA
jgi:polyhydroxyalkanoate synthase